MPDAEEGTVERSIFEGLSGKRVFKNAFKQNTSDQFARR